MGNDANTDLLNTGILELVDNLHGQDKPPILQQMGFILAEKILTLSVPRGHRGIRLPKTLTCLPVQLLYVGLLGYLKPSLGSTQLSEP